MPDLQQQAAKALCPECKGKGLIPYFANGIGIAHHCCSICSPPNKQGTGLRWPTLSFSSRGGNPNYERVPDVTLMKVLNLLPSGWKLEESDFGYVVTSCGEEYHNAIPEEAACAALLKVKDNYFSPEI